MSEPTFVDSFERFYADSWQTVYRALVVGIGDIDLAREAVDEAMARAYERWRTVSTMANREGWVYRVASNWATSRLRRRKHQLRPLPSTTVTHDPEVVDLAVAVTNSEPVSTDPDIWLGLKGPAPAFDTSALGPDLSFTPGQPSGDDLDDRINRAVYLGELGGEPF